MILILCNLYKKLCIKLVSIKELYYDARPTKSQDNDYMFRPLIGHHQVVYTMKMGLGAVQYT